MLIFQRLNVFWYKLTTCSVTLKGGHLYHLGIYEKREIIEIKLVYEYLKISEFAWWQCHRERGCSMNKAYRMLLYNWTNLIFLYYTNWYMSCKKQMDLKLNTLLHHMVKKQLQACCQFNINFIKLLLEIL